jgi:hypothetical protein
MVARPLRHRSGTSTGLSGVRSNHKINAFSFRAAASIAAADEPVSSTGYDGGAGRSGAAANSPDSR